MTKTTSKSPDFLNNLNAAQKTAVTHENGPLLIVAGAGTGKTTVLINRLAYLIQEKKVHPEQIPSPLRTA
jgi:DNA helicase-2/ATP-dependent DNA helicase PcrA